MSDDVAVMVDWRQIARVIPTSVIVAEAQRRGLMPGSQGFIQRKNSNGWDESYRPAEDSR